MDSTGIGAAVVKGAVAGIAHGLVESLAKLVKAPHQNTEATIAPRLEQNLNAILSWSERIQFWGLPTLETDTCSVALNISGTPRRFASKDRVCDWDESKILAAPGHLLLVGDPGAGKSTTLKRLCRRLLLSEPQHPDDHLAFPIVIRLRSVELDASLCQWLATSIGLGWKLEEPNPSGFLPSDLRRFLVGERELSEVVIELLEEARPLVCIDGMDEVPTGRRERLEDELAELAAKLRRARLVITTRSGDYVRAIEGIDVLELLPLTDDQIAEISANVLGEPETFLSSARSLPVYESLRRPIALMQTLVLFKTSGALPDQPSITIRKLVDLYLEEWDFHNRLRRESKYASFPPRRKHDFLAAVAFHLMYRSGAQSFVFDQRALERIYKDIHASFGLPPEQAEVVAREIETHTGIVHQARLDSYEFTDLATQEYLAATYIVRDPFASRAFGHLVRYPGPVAVAIALAPDSVNWMGNLFLHRDVETRLGSAATTMPEFLRRLQIERPYFYESGILGYAVLKIADSFSENTAVMDALAGLLDMPFVFPSLRRALTAYSLDNTISTTMGLISVTLRRSESLGASLLAPTTANIPKVWCIEREE